MTKLEKKRIEKAQQLKLKRARIAKAKKVLKNKSKKVKKMLSPEESTALSNIQSIVSELLQMSSGGGSPDMMAEEEVAMADDMPMEDEEEYLVEEGADEDEYMEDEEYQEDDNQGKEVKMIVKNLGKILKGLEETPSDAATASDDAEERIDEVQTELSEENLQEVAKAIALLLRGGKQVKKSTPKGSNLERILSKLVEVQKSNQSDMNEMATSFAHVLEGLGISKQLKVTKAEDSKVKQINKAGNEELLNFLQTFVNKSEETKSNTDSSQETTPQSQGNQVRKNLADANVLSALVGR